MTTKKMKENYCPIFVGGTGRSGTTIMGKYLDSHRSLVTPVHENKLIVEEGGLRSLVNNLSSGFEYKSNHYAISQFVELATTLRTYGFRNRAVSFLYRGTNKVLHIASGKRIPASAVCRAMPFFKFSLIGIGEKYGHAHYDNCIAQFFGEVVRDTDGRGIVDTEGLIKPVYSSRTSNRDELLEYARNFLLTLNSEKMRQAGAERWCDDTPLNACYGEFLLELYPSGKVIHMVRDPRDVVASYMERSWASDDLEMTLNRLKRQYQDLKKVEEALPRSSFRTFRLEDLTSEPDIRQNDLCEFLGIDPDGFDGTVRFQPSSFGRWKNKFSGKAADLIETHLSEACAHFGYQ